MMAEAIDPETSLQRAVGCAVCFESMVDSRTLVPCMHTFCAECVTKINQEIEDGTQGILCPLCRTFIAQDDIKPNPFVNSVIEMIVRQESRDKTDVSLEAAQSVEEKNITVFCSKHSNREIERNCVHCNQVVCAECLYDDHNGHKSERIEEALNRIRPQVRRAIADITVKINDRKSMIKSLKETNDKISNNKSTITDQITKHKDMIIKQFVDKVNEEYEDLVSSFDVNVSPKSKELELSRDYIENSVVSDQSLVTWILTFLDNTDGGGLLRELQSGLLTRIQQIQEYRGTYDVKLSPTKLYEFLPMYPKHRQQLLGEIKIQEDPVVKTKMSVPNVQAKESDPDNDNQTVQTAAKFQSFERLKLAAINPDNMYRLSKVRMYNLRKRIKIVNTVELENCAYRLCLFKGQIWIPCYSDNIITVISLDGSVQRTIKLESFTYPHSLHPLHSDQLALAATSGLYILDSDGHVQHQLKKEFFHDVHVDKHTLAAVTDDKVYIWDVSTDECKQTGSCDVTYNCLYRTVHVRHPYIYVSGGDSHSVHKYSMTGEHQGQIGGHSARLNIRGLCMSDDDYNLLVCHDDKNITVMAHDGSVVTTLKIKSNGINDVVIHENTLYVLEPSGKILICKPQAP